MKIYKFKLPLKQSEIDNLKVGDIVQLTGKIYCFRDQVHKRLLDKIHSNEKLPIDLKNSAIYYVGPSPTMPNQIVGSAGPTTSNRMDFAAPTLYDKGVKITIGKGERSEEVVNSIIKNKALYLVAIGGTGSLLAKSIKSINVVAYPELLSESLKVIEVENFEAIVGINSKGEKFDV